METLGVTSNGLCHSSDGWLHTFYIGYHHCQIIPFIPDMTGHHTVKLQQYIVSDFLLLYTHCVNTGFICIARLTIAWSSCFNLKYSCQLPDITLAYYWPSYFFSVCTCLNMILFLFIRRLHHSLDVPSYFVVFRIKFEAVCTFRCRDRGSVLKTGHW